MLLCKCYYIFSTNSISNMYAIQCTIIEQKNPQLRDVMTMTPYYSSWWSRTWVVAVVTVICTLLFILGIISAFSVAK